MPADQYQPPDRRPVGNFHAVPDEDMVFATTDLGRGADTEDQGAEPPQVPADRLPGIAFVQAAQPAPLPEPAAGMEFVEAAPAAAPDAPVGALSFAEPQAAAGAAAPNPGLPGISFDSPSPPIASMSGFHLSTAAPAAPAGELPWITRDPVPVRPETAREGWRRRWSDEVDRAATASMKALRNEALHVTWKAAWTAVTTAGDGVGTTPPG